VNVLQRNQPSRLKLHEIALITESIVPGFDTPVAGEHPAPTADQENVPTTGETSGGEASVKADEPRRSYQEEEDRP